MDESSATVDNGKQDDKNTLLDQRIKYAKMALNGEVQLRFGMGVVLISWYCSMISHFP